MLFMWSHKKQWVYTTVVPPKQDLSASIMLFSDIIYHVVC